MTDLAKRPKGGWQVGTHLSGLGRGGPVWLQGKADPAPDVCTVTRQPGGRFLVKHYPSADAADPCCVLELVQRPGETDIDTLARGDRFVERKHGGAG